MWRDKPIFRDAELQQEVWTDGFAVRRLVSEEAAAEILEEACNIARQFDVEFSPNGPDGLGVHLTNFHPSEDYRRAISRLVEDRLEDAISDSLIDYRVVGSTLFMKPPGHGEVEMHADHSLQVDLEWPTISAWLALADATIENGTLEFIPGSHAIFSKVWRLTPPYYAAFPELQKLTIPVPVSAGEVIFFDPSSLHRSKPNKTEEWRNVLLLGCIPKSRTGVHSYVEPDEPDRVQFMRFDREDRLAYSEEEIWSGRLKTEHICSAPLDNQELAPSEVLAIFKNAEKIRNGERTVVDVASAASRSALPSGAIPYAQKTYFRDPAQQEQFVQKGYIRHQLLSREAAADLLKKVVTLGPDDNFSPADGTIESVSYHMTELDSNPHYKNMVWQESRAQFDGIVDDLLVDYRIQNATLFVKPPGKGAIPPHTDWTVQEDNEWPTIYIWCPLVDLTAENGPLGLVEGSHGVLDILHGPRTIPAYATGLDDMSDHMKILEAAAGEAIIFDSNILHGSKDNLTDQPRFALRLACVPKARRGVLHRASEHNPNVIETFSMEAEDLFKHDGVELVTGQFKSKMIRRVIQPPLELTSAELLELVAQGGRIRNGETTMEAVVAAARLPATPNETFEPPVQRSIPYRVYRKVRGILGKIRRRLFPVEHVASALPEAENAAFKSVQFDGPDYAPYPAVSGDWRPFENELIDSALQKEGYATFSFLPPAKIDELAQVIDAAEAEFDNGDVHIETHFQLSAFNNDGAYKERLFNAIWNNLEASVTDILPGYEPLVINVFDKPPSEAYDPVPIHQNPSFVDEPANKSVSLWIPLCDVSKDNGTVGVLPQSHNRFNRIRSGNMAHEDIFAQVQDQLENEWFVPVEMKKGEMLALDDSIIHWSYPNVSDVRRKAVQLIMVPRGVPHIYYYYDEEGPDAPMMDLYAVDHNFFFGFNCKARPETLPKIGRVPYHYRPISESEIMLGRDTE